MGVVALEVVVGNLAASVSLLPDYHEQSSFLCCGLPQDVLSLYRPKGNRANTVGLNVRVRVSSLNRVPWL